MSSNAPLYQEIKRSNAPPSYKNYETVNTKRQNVFRRDSEIHLKVWKPYGNLTGLHNFVVHTQPHTQPLCVVLWLAWPLRGPRGSI
jgi:hypothetical protein